MAEKFLKMSSLNVYSRKDRAEMTGRNNLSDIIPIAFECVPIITPIPKCSPVKSTDSLDHVVRFKEKGFDESDERYPS